MCIDECELSIHSSDALDWNPIDSPPPTPHHHHHLHPPPEVLEKHGQFLSLLHTQDISILNQKMWNQKMKRDKSSEFKPSLHGTLFLFHVLTWDIEQHLVWSPLL